MRPNIATLLAFSLIAPGLFFATTLKPAESHELCPTFWDKLNPLKQCSHTHFTGKRRLPPVTYVKIENRASGRCLDLQPQNNRNGGYANVYDCLAHPNQTWVISDLGSGNVSIGNRASGRCLDIQPQNNQNGGYANVYDCLAHPNQTWIISDAGNGDVRIMNKAWGRCLDLQPQNNQNGGYANVYDCLAHPNQTWRISITQ